MELLIVRHAHAGSREAFAKTGQPDDLRPLTQTGVRDMKDVARVLHAILPAIDSIVTSPLVRARQTADIVADEYGVPIVESDALRPQAEFESFVNWMRRDTADDIIAAVGHEPHLSGLIAYLIGDSGDACIDLKKSGAGLIEFDDRPARGRGKLRWLITPKIVRTTGLTKTETNKNRD